MIQRAALSKADWCWVSWFLCVCFRHHRPVVWGCGVPVASCFTYKRGASAVGVQQACVFKGGRQTSATSRLAPLPSGHRGGKRTDGLQTPKYSCFFCKNIYLHILNSQYLPLLSDLFLKQHIRETHSHLFWWSHCWMLLQCWIGCTWHLSSSWPL